jgi:hypothetical protein
MFGKACSTQYLEQNSCAFQAAVCEHAVRVF